MPTTALNPAGFLRECRDLVANTDPLAVSGKLTRVAGLVLEASGLRLAVGNCCRVLLPNGSGARRFRIPPQRVLV